ncbi:NF-kappa-B essential modulator isoform X2 [Polyodon spathula]|uniref:NF-kappa-B essential modulator isoform X2 n=1 Tax=Polyodon spathula TaxID=7913 RepID=UPI001B7EC561|nr:NF-kappa-B essential modulator isoform X2 [Polyodon spathula]
MVQPNGIMGNELKSDMIGGEGSMGLRGQGSLQIPPELASNEIVQRVVSENQDLRDAIRQSNQALRERYEEMLSFRARSREEREFLLGKFREARSLVERLTRDKTGLQRENQELRSSLQLVPDRTTEQEKMEVGEERAPSRESSGGSPSCLGSYNTLTQSMCEAEKPERDSTTAKPREEGGNEFLLLLKERKEELEESLSRMKERNERLEREREELESRLRESERRQGSGGKETSRNAALQSRVESLQKTTAQLERSEARLKLRERELEREGEERAQKLTEQLTKDSEPLKAQVTSLLGELQERQASLESCQRDRSAIEEKLRQVSESRRALEKECELMRKQHSVSLDQLRMKAQDLEAALKLERLTVSEEKRKLAQLQHAYTTLFQDYDQQLKKENANKHKGLDLEDLKTQLQEAENALVLKQELIDKLKEESERNRGALETVPVLTAQAEIYRADFLAERQAREQLHQQKEVLQEQLQQLSAQLEGASRARMEELQQRHLENYRPPLQHPLPQPAAFAPMAGGATVPFSPAQEGGGRRHSYTEEQPDYRCPKCQYQAPDMDTLQIHVMDCIQ